MGQMYYYQTEFQLKDEVPFLNVVKAYAEDDDLTEADLRRFIRFSTAGRIRTAPPSSSMVTPRPSRS